MGMISEEKLVEYNLAQYIYIFEIKQMSSKCWAEPESNVLGIKRFL